MDYKCVIGLLLVSVAASQQVPRINSVLENEGFNAGASGLINLWNHALRLQPNLRDDKSILTVLSPDSFRMINLVPQDSGHPLYDDSVSNSALRTEFIQDYLFLDSIDPNDPQLLKNNGLNKVNLNGNSVNFKKSASGSITINGVGVTDSVKLSDGTNLYILDGFLFGHDVKVKAAWDILQSQRTPGCGWC